MRTPKYNSLPLVNYEADRTRVRVAGIEPASLAWEASIMPLDHTREIIYQSARLLAKGKAKNKF